MLALQLSTQMSMDAVQCQTVRCPLRCTFVGRWRDCLLKTRIMHYSIQTIESIPKHLEMETNWLPPPATHHYVYTSSISYNLRVAVTDIDTHVTRRREKQVVKTGATETRRHLELITTHHNLRGRRQKCSHGNR